MCRRRLRCIRSITQQISTEKFNYSEAEAGGISSGANLRFSPSEPAQSCFKHLPTSTYIFLQLSAESHFINRDRVSHYSSNFANSPCASPLLGDISTPWMVLLRERGSLLRSQQRRRPVRGSARRSAGTWLQKNDR